MKKFRLITTQSLFYPTNRICNMKYRWYSIVFRVLLQQFVFFFNTYFFIIAITQFHEKCAITSPLTSMGPWLMVFFITLFKEAFDDYKRNERDFHINNQLYTVYRNKAFRLVKSKDIKVGDLIILEKDQRVPADVVLLKASDQSGQLFLRTDQLDGETDWKMRSAVQLTQKAEFSVLKDIKVLAEEPSKEIYSFNGIISTNDIDLSNIQLEKHSESNFVSKYLSNLISREEKEGELVDSEVYSFIQRSDIVNSVKNDDIILGVEGNDILHKDLVLPTDVNNEVINNDVTDKSPILNDSSNTTTSSSNNTTTSSNNNSYINSDKAGLSLENMLWMNTVVATCSALCCVVYTGNDTRAMINTSKPRNKVGSFDMELNTYSKFLGVTSASVAGFFAYMKGFNSNGLIAFVRFLVLFSSVIPISLKVTIDMARYVYAYYIANDSKIPNTIVRNSSLPEELGRISYFLSDKTGTLTKNEMEMKKIHLGTIAFTQDLNEEISKKLAKYCSKKDEESDIFSRNKKDINDRLFELVEGLVLCHNVTPVIDEKITYQASSPDEVAIVKWTEIVGMKLYKRDRDSITVLDSLNDEQVYEILDIFPFTSETKRMGIIVQKKSNTNTDNDIIFFMKGADAVMTKIIQPTDWVDEETENMARDGLRTLVIAKKVLTTDQYSKFKKKYEGAKSTLTRRQENIQKAMDLLESDLTVLGLTGVEDKLQDKVKITLENLRNAGIKIWMLTGDKIETAISIATSSKIFDKTTEYKIVTDLEENFNFLDAVVIDGNSLGKIIDSNKLDSFIMMCLPLKAVVGCRFSPTQKALVARALRTLSKKIVCCIGDGGNDVSMITEANIGVGIVGKEGNQASLAADYSIEKFCYVMDLFFWHGRNSYRNSASIAYLVIHRGTILSVLQGLFCALINFIPFNIYHGVVLIAFISCYTFFPIFSVVFSVDVSREVADMFPELYKELVDSPLLSIGDFSQWNFMSFYQGTIIMFFMIYSFKEELFSISTLTFTSLIINEILMVFLTTSRISKQTVLACMTSLVLYFMSFVLFKSLFYINMDVLTFIGKVLVANVIAIMPEILIKGAHYWKPSSTSKLESRV